METIILGIILIICVLTDILKRKILNLIIFPSILFAFILHIVNSGMDGILFSGKGFLIGISLLIFPFALGGIGAGDVKLLGTVGAYKGSLFVFNTFIYAAFIGGVIALILVVKNKTTSVTFKQIQSLLLHMGTKQEGVSLQNTNSTSSIPYAVAIASGTLLTYLLEGVI